MLGLPVIWGAVEQLEHSVRTGEAALQKTQPEGFWAYFEKHPGEAQTFDAAMGAKATTHVGAILASYDFSGWKAVVDVGGGRGHLLRAVVEKAPGACGVLFDLPHVVESARQNLSHPRIGFQAGDFFTDPIPSGDGYLLMEILHDWDDERSQAILKAIRRAAPPGARLLVLETVVPPDPGPGWAKLLDLLMLILFAGKQRTRPEYEQLLEPAGFRLQREIDTGVGISIFEAEAV